MTVRNNENDNEDDREERDNSGGNSATSTTIDTTPNHYSASLVTLKAVSDGVSFNHTFTLHNEVY